MIKGCCPSVTYPTNILLVIMAGVTRVRVSSLHFHTMQNKSCSDGWIHSLLHLMLHHPANEKDVPYLLLLHLFCLGPSSPKQRPGQEQGIASAIDNGTGASTLSRFHVATRKRDAQRPATGQCPFRAGVVFRRDVVGAFPLGHGREAVGSTTGEERVRVPLYATDAFLAGGLAKIYFFPWPTTGTLLLSTSSTSKRVRSRRRSTFIRLDKTPPRAF